MEIKSKPTQQQTGRKTMTNPDKKTTTTNEERIDRVREILFFVSTQRDQDVAGAMLEAINVLGAVDTEIGLNDPSPMGFGDRPRSS